MQFRSEKITSAELSSILAQTSFIGTISTLYILPCTRTVGRAQGRRVRRRPRQQPPDAAPPAVRAAASPRERARAAVRGIRRDPTWTTEAGPDMDRAPLDAEQERVRARRLLARRRRRMRPPPAAPPPAGRRGPRGARLEPRVHKVSPKFVS